MSDLDKLIADLEAATEGSRELDARIAVACFKTQSTGEDLVYAKLPGRSDGCAPGTYWRKSRSGASLQTAINYTTSLDDALPGEHIYMVRKRHDGKWVAGDERERKGSFVAIGATEVLARRIAAVSPKLSESRSQGYLELLDGKRWRITSKGREFLAPQKA